MKLFVWDFHGVLEDGNEDAVLEISNAVLAMENHPERFTKEEVVTLYGKKWYEYFEYLLPGISNKEHLALQEKCIAYQQGSSILAKYVKPTMHSHDVLNAISVAGHEQIIISNCNPESLDEFVECAGVRSFFPDGRIIAVSSHIPGIHSYKADALRRFIDGKSYDGFVIIGDSPSDIELASICNGTSYLYTHPSRTPRKCSPDHRISDLRELLKEI